MNILYVADNGFSINEGSFFYSRPNLVNSSQYLKYFSKICFIARKSEFRKTMIPIETDVKVRLVGRYDIFALKKAMIDMKGEYDVVLVRNGLLGCFAAIYAKKLGKKLVSYCGADPYEFQFSQGTLKGRIIARLWRHLEKKKMKIGDYAHYCTKVLYERYPSNGPYLICSNVSVKSDKNVLEARLKRIVDKRDITKIGLMGQFVENDRKGISTVIKALKILDGDYIFEIVGEGPTERYDSLIEGLNEKSEVHFLGYISDKQKIIDWLDQIDIYVQPSLSEGLPRATIEAMSRGCPVVASNVCGMVDILSEDYLISPNDFESFAKKIKRISTPVEMERAARANFSTASNYSEEIRDKKMDAFYQRIVEDNIY